MFTQRPDNVTKIVKSSTKKMHNRELQRVNSKRTADGRRGFAFCLKRELERDNKKEFRDFEAFLQAHF
jgi:hypothetical protein